VPLLRSLCSDHRSSRREDNNPRPQIWRPRSEASLLLPGRGPRNRTEKKLTLLCTGETPAPRLHHSPAAAPPRMASAQPGQKGEGVSYCRRGSGEVGKKVTGNVRVALSTNPELLAHPSTGQSPKSKGPTYVEIMYHIQS
jgi:hypothetical protein